jgi:hypothetical protein
VEGEVWPQPSRLKTWEGPDGKVWHRAGDTPLKLTGVRRLVHDQAVEVVLFYGVVPKFVVTADDRAELWSRIEPVMRGQGADNPYADFRAFRYRDDNGNKLLAVEESC